MFFEFDKHFLLHSNGAEFFFSHFSNEVKILIYLSFVLNLFELDVEQNVILQNVHIKASEVYSKFSPLTSTLLEKVNQEGKLL